MRIAYHCEEPECLSEPRGYATELEARTCETQPRRGLKNLALGDFVVSPSECLGYRHPDIDMDWIANPDVEARCDGPDVIRRHHPDNPGLNCFGPCCNFQVIYVVTDVRSRQHRWIYTLATYARRYNGVPAHGWTSRGHITHWEPAPKERLTPKVVNAGNAVVGKITAARSKLL